MMKRSPTRPLLAPSLLALSLLVTAVASVSPSALASSGDRGGHHAPPHADHHDGHHGSHLEGHRSGDHGRHHRGHPDDHRRALFERAGIDDETREALEAARTEHREAVRELRETHRQRIDEILDDEQREALATARQALYEEQRQEWRNERRQAHREAMQQRLTALVDTWQLSDTERETLREVREAIYTDMQALRAREFDSREERREAMRELREAHQEALSRILSDEQLAEMREAIEPRRRHGMEKHGRDGGKGSGQGASLND
ncbi:hypothetical protein [Halomonas saccharevitans]|uniref:LTXXQ motif family protein n=1 Tax=Halomonas saccharevitans TaxID=416872 RepID=A0A1I6XRA0_9GAMM|nr:hypothetical protein [Halomonas saccharevitans]SFT40214.1 hypothetical protein SAMN04487956_10346 [Halomonas saccharevitans]